MCKTLVRLAAFGVALACLPGCGRPGERPSSAVPAGATTSAAPATTNPAAPAPARVIDLGHALSSDDPTWSGKPAFTHTTMATIAKETYFGATFSADEHFGTHVDAPAHFWAEGWTVDRIPADRLVQPAVCVNVVSKAAADEDYRVTADDLQAFERANGRIPELAIVFIATGWDARWPDAAKYMNARGGTKHFPGLTVDAALFLARERRVAAIGIDTPSIDHGPSANFEAHRASMAENVYHIENATGLTTLPATGFTAMVAPIKIKGGSGGPARVFALVK
jgi:kynurenine formamidase